MVHVSAAYYQRLFKLPEDDLRCELSAFIGKLARTLDKEDVHADKSDDDLFNFIY